MAQHLARSLDRRFGQDTAAPLNGPLTSTWMKRSASASVFYTSAAERQSQMESTVFRVKSTKAVPGGKCYQKPFERAYKQLSEQRNLRRLEALFMETDTDGSGEISLQEFREALRKPWIQRSFSLLGVQPHQAEVIFKAMDKEQVGELSIHAFIHGLETVVGSDLSGQAQELDVETLRPAHKAKMRSEARMQASYAMYAPPVKTSESKKPPSEEALSTPGFMNLATDLMPEKSVQRAFTHSASAMSLHAATASKRSWQV